MCTKLYDYGGLQNLNTHKFENFRRSQKFIHVKSNTFKVWQGNWNCDFNFCDCFSWEGPFFRLSLWGAYCFLNLQHDPDNKTRKSSLSVIVVVNNTNAGEEEQCYFSSPPFVLYFNLLPLNLYYEIHRQILTYPVGWL